MRPGDPDVVVGQEHDLDVEEQHDGQHDERQPAHAVQEGAHHPAAVGTGDRLHEEEVVELEAQGVRALVGCLEQADRLIELERLAGEQRELGDEPQVQEDEHDRRELEELRKLDLDLQDRQLDRSAEKQVLVRHARNRDHEIGHDAEEDEPRRMRRIARIVHRLEQAIGIDRRLPLGLSARQLRHDQQPPRQLLACRPLDPDAETRPHRRPHAQTTPSSALRRDRACRPASASSSGPGLLEPGPASSCADHNGKSEARAKTDRPRGPGVAARG